MLADRTRIFTESVIREMTRICDAAGGYNLSQGFPDFESPRVLKDAAIAAINAQRKPSRPWPIGCDASAGLRARLRETASNTSFNVSANE